MVAYSDFYDGVRVGSASRVLYSRGLVPLICLSAAIKECVCQYRGARSTLDCLDNSHSEWSLVDARGEYCLR